MNTFGKTLVICNMVVAIGAAALFVLVHYRSTNWKEGFEDLKDRLTVSEGKAQILVREKSEKVQESLSDKAIIKSSGERILEREKELEAEINVWKLKAEDASRDAAADALSKEKIGNENARLKLENQALQKTLQTSEQTKLDLQKAANDTYKKLEDVKNERDRLQIRNDNLAEIIRQKDKLIQELSTRGGVVAGVPGPVPGIVRGPNEPNPPATKVKGHIERIDRKPGDAGGVLLQLSVGTDHGVNRNNTLDVYRLEPRPEYLGVIRIIDVYPQKSIGRLMRAASNNPLREGDIVVDSIGSP